jgi:hypothetical protein
MSAARRMPLVLWDSALVGGALYTALAHAVWTSSRHASATGVSQDEWLALCLLGMVVGCAGIAVRAARAEAAWWPARTMLTSAAAAALGAVGHTLHQGFLAGWDHECHGCNSFLYLTGNTLKLMVLAAVVSMVPGLAVHLVRSRKAARATGP